MTDMPIPILLSEPFHERYGDRLHAAASEAGLVLDPVLLAKRGTVADEDLERVELAHFSRDRYVAGGQPLFEALERAPHLRWLHVFHAGMNGRFYARLLERDVLLSNSSGSHAEPIAQTVIGALLRFARGFAGWQEAQQEHRWARLHAPYEPADLRGQTIVIVGVGAIGTHIGRIAQALGLHVVGVRRSPGRPGEPIDEFRTPSELSELLPRADWLVLSCPLTSETRGLIDADALARLPRHARLFNVARGPVVVETALIDALWNGTIAGAHVDVFDEEPLPEDSPLWDLPNLILTPHNSSVSSGNDDRATAIFLDNLGRWKRGEPLVNRVTTVD
jgi:phosphoglycerate dehydrogenase-like enzyme